MSDPLSRAKASRKEEKELRKALETPEEKRLRRLAKKEAKEKKRKQKLGCEDYTNTDNPFGDDNLEATFIWRKKYEKMGQKDIDEKEIIRENNRRLEETRRELEAVKQRRLQREKEYEERQEEMNRIQREKEMAHYNEFEKQEATFHLKQARLRSRIRIRDGRAKPIDHLAQYFDAFTDPVPEDDETFIPKTEEDIEDEETYLLSRIEEPYEVLNGLRRIDLEDLLEDINVYKELEKKRDLSFWNDMTVIVEDELAKLRNYASKGRGGDDHERREGINSAVVAQVNTLLHGKTPTELAALKTQVEDKIKSREEGVDITYWETILSKLKAVMAKARLRERHEKNMQIRYERLKIIKPRESGSSSTSYATSSSSSRDRYSSKHSDRDRSHRSSHRSDDRRDRDDRHRRRVDDRDRDESRRGRHEEKEKQEHKESKPNVEVKKEDEEKTEDPLPGPSGLQSTTNVIGQEAVKKEEDDDDERQEDVDEEDAPEMTLIQECKQDYVSGRYSPVLIAFDSLEVSEVSLISPEDDERNRYLQRTQQQQRHPSTAAASLASAAESAFDSEAKKGMSRDEVQFSVEEAIRQDKSVLSWSEKYKARKPRYFNRVHTGFEWNKYNQTHYDTDNPPPKIVQGYKFNLFYPDLIEKNKAPKYTITPCPDNREFAIIRFSAGPPYEDIAFKIVNREWNYSHRSGFRSQFNNGILQLWFHFKRYRYRR